MTTLTQTTRDLTRELHLKNGQLQQASNRISELEREIEKQNKVIEVLRKRLAAKESR